MGPRVRYHGGWLQRALNFIRRFSIWNATFTPVCWTCEKLIYRIPDHGLLLCEDCALSVERPRHPMCTICGEPLVSGNSDRPCPRCAAHPPTFVRARALFTYAGLVPDIVLKLKYGGAYYLAPLLGRAMAAAALEDGMANRCEVVVAVPLRPARHLARGYNQSALLASAVARHLGVVYAPSALRRLKDYEPKDRMTRAQRLSRVKGCFGPGRSISAIVGRNVLLIDDVVTTGATAAECSAVLVAAGAKSVEVLSLARACAT